jgi:hypothetical protein
MISNLTRRAFGIGAIAAAWAEVDNALATTSDPGQIAVIDTPSNAAKVVSKLVAKNVKVVARYFARGQQPSLPEKIMSADSNMIGNDREPSILTAHGLSIISAYQYMNNQPQKFLKGLTDTGSAANEVAADANAALSQAKTVKQPEGTAIYFGVDFNLTQHKYVDGRLARSTDGEPVENSEMISAVLAYFRALNKTIGNHYALGVYGNGFVNRLLRDADLVKYSWISASRSFEETSEFFNSGRWHLFQNQVDRRWFEIDGRCPSGLDIDTEVQNPGVDGVGVWGNGEVEALRTKTIFSQRRFAARRTIVMQSGGDRGSPIERLACEYDSDNRRWTNAPERSIGRNASARVISQSGSWAAIDMDDDGALDGYVRTSDLTADFSTMPPWDRSTP